MTSLTETKAWVIDYEKAEVLFAELHQEKIAESHYTWYCPATHNFYTELDLFDTEQAALEYYLGQIIAEKKDVILWWDNLDKKINLRLAELIR